MQVAATAQAIELVRAAGNRLYVWSNRTAGCQPMTYLETSTEPADGAIFQRAPFAPFELYLATDGRWPDQLQLDVSRGHLGRRGLEDRALNARLRSRRRPQATPPSR